uniref:Tyrosine specific protein phosphatases domain-containing protein n=1 Tax=Trypanosoma congolense (strain IL3000) TaxID=1068625 RepID=G0UZ22_TRYCI|nr:conserved hypothetical protein [Trypanosoma congolense IL3000]
MSLHHRDMEEHGDGTPLCDQGVSAMPCPAGQSSDSLTDTLQESLSSVSKAIYFWGSLTATVLPGYFGQKMGIVNDFHHWNFITDNCVLGALPVVTKVGESGDHLVQLREQLKAKSQVLGLVVACMEEIEIRGFGISMIQFADEAAWRYYVNPLVEYVRLPMADTTADVSPKDVAQAVDCIHRCISKRRQAAYIHCKAGKGRSWMVTMCYLTTYGGMTFEDAEKLVAARRPQVNPSESQRNFAMKFATGEKRQRDPSQ